MRAIGLMILGVSILAGVAGCGSNITETGYEPRKLGISDGARKALYAPKYSPEAAQAQAEQEAASKARKPGGGFLQ